MKILLTTKAGTRAQTRKTVTGEWMRVGRNAACEIHLPDPRVALDQGIIFNRDGLVYIEGEAGSQNITRKTVRSVRLKVGEPIEIGPYRLEAQQPPPGFDGAIAVELVHALPQGTGFNKRDLTLASLGLTKRWAAWLWGLAILVVFLAVPAGRVLDLPWRDTAQVSPTGDKFWNPGALILAHQPIETKCATCHEVAFEHVKDRACLECHSSIGHHVGPEMNPASLFEGARCATCHRDHKGVKSTHRDSDKLCVNCHRDLPSHARDAKAANVSDFARDHPEFQLTFPVSGGVRRVRQGGAKIVEQSNLVFPHSVHLDPRGVRSPLQGHMKLECKACHQPDASRRTFEPVSMAKNCQECHALQFEPAVTTREVPHGKPAEAITVIEEFYANLALKGVPDSFRKAFGVPGEGLLRRTGEPSTQDRQNTLALASRKAKQVSKELFEVRVCKTCHAIEQSGDTWKVAPIRANSTWMPHARFDHKAHQQSKCADCHAVAQSKNASDVAMPTIKQCRECHGGSKPVAGKVTSNCMQCHGFHDATHAWDPTFQPKARRVAGNP